MTPQPQPAMPAPARRGKEARAPAADARLDEGVVAPRRASAAAPPPKPEQHWFATTTVVVLVMLGAAAWYFLLGPGRGQFAGLPGGGSRGGGDSKASLPPPVSAAPVAASSPGPVVDSALQGFDRLADSVTVAVRGYEDRAKLFGSRQLDCNGLSHGLVTVEDLWTNYNKGKKKTPPLDATRTARDQTLYTAVDSVERHYDRSQCERP